MLLIMVPFIRPRMFLTNGLVPCPTHLYHAAMTSPSIITPLALLTAFRLH